MIELISTITATGDSGLFDPKVRITLESFLTALRVDEGTEQVLVPKNLASLHSGNLRGLMREMGIEESAHWIVLRTSGYTNFFDDLLPDPGNGEYYLLSPNAVKVAEIRQAHLTLTK